MTNRAAQFRTAVQTTYPGASVVARGRKHIRHQHPTDPNKFIIDNTVGPIHYGASFDQEIDTAWQPTTGAWDYEMTTNDHQAYARDTFNVGDIFRFEKDGEYVQFDPQSLNWNDENYSQQQIAIKQAVTAVVDEARLSFPEAYGTGRHFEYLNKSSGLAKLITIDAPTDLPVPNLQGQTIHFVAEFSLEHSNGLEIYLDDVLWEKPNGVRVKTANRVEFRLASTGEVYWWLDFARAWDSGLGEAFSSTTGELEVRRQGGPGNLFITVRIPKTWIDTATFPIYLDPTIDTSVTDGDDDAHERLSDSDFDGTNTVLRYSSHATAAYRVGTRFDGVSAINSGDTIDAAYITIDAINSGNDDMNGDLHCEDVDSPANFATDADVANRTLTASSVAWVSDGLGTSPVNSPSIVTPVQAVVDRAGFGGVIMVIFEGNTDVTKNFFARSFEDGTDIPALHVEYTAAGGPTAVVKDIIGGGLIPFART